MSYSPQVKTSSQPTSTTMIEDSANIVAVVVPMYKKELDDEEQISYRHLTHYLGDFDKYLVSPESLDVGLEGFDIKRFRDQFFHSTATYSALLISPEFYQAFIDYEYILLYQLDSLVFSSRLLDWCARDFDYIGAPWFTEDGADFVDESAVGNGGLSLRKIGSFLKVLDAPGAVDEMDKYRDALRSALPWYERAFHLPNRVRKWLSLSGTKGQDILTETEPVPAGKRLNEDCFWSFRARDYYPDFKIAPVKEALNFSFEMAPRRCFELNGKRLPFGCHAWSKYDVEFWEPYLLK